MAAEVITASTLPQQSGLSYLCLSCLVSFSLLAPDNVFGPPSVGTDRDGDLNTSSDVIRLQTSEAREVRGLRLGNFRFVFSWPLKFLTFFLPDNLSQTKGTN